MWWLWRVGGGEVYVEWLGFGGSSGRFPAE